MDQLGINLLVNHLKIEPQRRKPPSHHFIVNFLKNLHFFQEMVHTQNFGNSNQYMSLLGYYLEYVEFKEPEAPLKFKENSFIIVLTGCIRRVEYDRDPAVVAKLLEQKLNYHRDKVYWKKDLMLFFQRKIVEIQPGDVFITDKTCDLITASPTTILYISPQKLRDAEILKNKSMRDQTNFLKNTIFWKKFDIEDLKELVISCSHIIYKTGQYVYKQNDPAQYVYLVRDGEFVYQRKIEVGSRKRRIVKEEEQVLVSKLVKGEVFGYNQILERKHKRAYSLKCCSFTGQLYVFSLDYWNFLYDIFHKQFEDLHRKCVNFRQNQTLKRVKSIEQNRSKFVKTPILEYSIAMRKDRSASIHTQMKHYYVRDETQSREKRRIPTQNPQLPRLKRHESIRNYSPLKQTEPQIRNFNDYYSRNRQKDHFINYRQKQESTLKFMKNRQAQSRNAHRPIKLNFGQLL